MRKNSIKDQMQMDVDSLSLKELADKFRFVRNQRKMLGIAEDAIKLRVRNEMGDNGELVLANDYKAVKQYKKTMGIEPERAMSIVGDNDLFAQIVKVDLKKAEEILPTDVWDELQSALVVEKTTEALVFRGFEEKDS